MQKKIFVLTGEPSGDKLASRVIAKLKSSKPDIEYLSVGGEHLKALGIESIYDLREITYLGFTKVLLNIFKIKKKINKTVDKIIEFNPDILFSVDSPDFTLRVAKKVKKLKSGIKTIHFVAPQVWVWREHRVKQLKSFLDHVLLLFPFEKKYFDKENIQSTFTGHPLLEYQEKSKIDISQVIKKDKKFFSIYPGSRISEIKVLMPILFKFVKLMNEKYSDIFFIFHSTIEHSVLIKNFLFKEKFENCEVISDEKIKSDILKKSIFAVAKSGTISLEICNAKVPSVIIYKMSKINFFIIKNLVKVKSPNIINIAADEEVIPELLQSKCNPKDIFKTVDKLLNDKNILEKQIAKSQEIINNFKKGKSSEIASAVLLNQL
ncbi:MAG: lipid-A-disaccharide synthase [Pelagibacteraceae bacterium]|jgi:lipid-A-disaccharide synthase|nr:lipid-A-disaccharide synthase [Candidatus Pelagibacter sp.]MDP6681321.1 lipid-A-disaccharide synthase [Pelagibacteraceae bacterium]MDP6709802.1 lipid-A-disaccharide synthase [Pelagibacteraceae bacterium]|tara:strand:+ start:971 stop:2101 length:1131 start_codon:yes stop_codon:yes gene_type:complete